MKPLAKALILVPAALSLLLAAPAGAQEGEPAKKATAPLDLSGDSEDIHLGDKEYSPYLDQGYPTRPYWGDTHVHTSYSTDAGMIGFRQIIGDVSSEFGEVPQQVLNMVANRVTQVREITENARSEIRSIVGEAIEEGLSEDETRAVLTERLDHAVDNLQSRARTIARTEVHGAYSEARKLAMDETRPVKKRWIAASDARDSHLACEAAGAIDYDDPFPNGLQYPMERGGPAGEVINCRCVLMPVYEGEE